MTRTICLMMCLLLSTVGCQFLPTLTPPTPTAIPFSPRSPLPAPSPTESPSPTVVPLASATIAPRPTTAPTAVPTAPPRPTLLPPVYPIMPSGPTPVMMIPNRDDPSKALPVDDSPHTLNSKSAVWYYFDYGLGATGERPVKRLTLVNAKESGVRFEVWSAANLANWWGQQPFGRGMANNVSCGGTPVAGQICQSNDLTWSGAFNIGGRYYVRVVNENDRPTGFKLTLR